MTMNTAGAEHATELSGTEAGIARDRIRDVGVIDDGGLRDNRGNGNALVRDVWGRPRTVEPVAVRFWRYVSPCPNTGCWFWGGSLNDSGYGQIVDDYPSRKKIRATRLSYQMHFGHCPAGLFVLHKCDQPACVNPQHLMLGTQSDNIQDALSKGRHRHFSAKGEGHPMRKLSDDDVRSIRKSDAPLKVLAKRYGVTMTSISYIRLGRTWSHVR